MNASMRPAIAWTVKLVLLMALVSSAHADQLKVMTYNIHFGGGPNGGARWAWDLEWIDCISEAIRRESPDVVGLQEVIAGGGKSMFRNQWRRIAEKTGYLAAYHEAHHDGRMGNSFGNMVLSRQPILSRAGPVTLMEAGEVTHQHAERRIASAFHVKFRGFPGIWFVNTHLHAGDAAVRIQNLDALQIKLLGGLAGPVVMMGDFNARASGPEIRHARSVLKPPTGGSFVDVLEVKGQPDPRTFLASDQHFRLDWILVSPADFSVRDARVLPWELSDHAPIVAILEPRAPVGPPAPTRPGTAPPPIGLLGVIGW